MNRVRHIHLTAESTPEERIAADWLVRREDGALSSAEAEALERWLAAGPEHRAAFRRMERVWQALAPAEAPSEPMAEPTAPPDPAPGRHRWPQVAGLAMAALLVLTLTLGYFQPRTSEHHYPSNYQTDRALLTVTLEDGSQLTLDANTRLSVNLGPDRREVELLTGKARFDVAPDPDRPFQVRAGPLQARVLGTVFDVDRRAEDGISVFVLEGQVEVLTAAPGVPAEAHLGGAGEAITWRRHRPMAFSADHDLDEASEWAEGRLVFRGEAAGSALALINRYERSPLQLPPGVSPATPVYGVFRTGDGAAFLTALADDTDH